MNKITMNQYIDDNITFWTSMKNLLNTPNECIINVDYDLKIKLVTKLFAVKKSKSAVNDMINIIRIFVLENKSQPMTSAERTFNDNLEKFIGERI